MAKLRDRKAEEQTRDFLRFKADVLVLASGWSADTLEDIAEAAARRNDAPTKQVAEALAAIVAGERK